MFLQLDFPIVLAIGRLCGSRVTHNLPNIFRSSISGQQLPPKRGACCIPQSICFVELSVKAAPAAHALAQRVHVE
jgi:hypothetical protein